jgi:hypothetical protein
MQLSTCWYRVDWWIRAITAALFSADMTHTRPRLLARPEWHSSAHSYHVGVLYSENVSGIAKSGDLEVRFTEVRHERNISIGEGRTVGLCKIIP